jgi:hypothetical protein
MDTNNIINEEVLRMKSLFGYQRGKVVSEQNLISELGIGGTIMQNQQNQSQGTPSIPTELKDINGVKAFQDWLDINHKGWATGYNDGVLNKIGKGYGRMGPRTTKAWTSYKDEYLKSLQPTPTPPANTDIYKDYKDDLDNDDGVPAGYD